MCMYLDVSLSMCNVHQMSIRIIIEKKYTSFKDQSGEKEKYIYIIRVPSGNAYIYVYGILQKALNPFK